MKALFLFFLAGCAHAPVGPSHVEVLEACHKVCGKVQSVSFGNCFCAEKCEP